jgi:uncharacterized membrane protein
VTSHQRLPARWPTRAAYALAALLLVTGTLHFVAPGGFESIVPRFLGPASFWVRASGVAELGCAVGLLVPSTRSYAGWACVVLFVAVFPANVQMAVDARGTTDLLVAWARLPLQVPLVLWAAYVARRREESGNTDAASRRQAR